MTLSCFEHNLNLNEVFKEKMLSEVKEESEYFAFFSDNLCSAQIKEKVNH